MVPEVPLQISCRTTRFSTFFSEKLLMKFCDHILYQNNKYQIELQSTGYLLFQTSHPKIISDY